MSTKSFTQVRKPARQPTPEEIAGFEQTGRADMSVKRPAQDAESRENRNTEMRGHADAESCVSGDTATQDHGNPRSQNGVDTEDSKHDDTETQETEPVVRLTIDLPESAHRRFKAACAITRRKMVEEVRGFIEQRTVELETEAHS